MKALHLYSINLIPSSKPSKLSQASYSENIMFLSTEYVGDMAEKLMTTDENIGNTVADLKLVL